MQETIDLHTQQIAEIRNLLTQTNINLAQSSTALVQVTTALAQVATQQIANTQQSQINEQQIARLTEEVFELKRLIAQRPGSTAES